MFNTEPIHAHDLIAQQKMRRNVMLLLMVALLAVVMGLMVTLSFVAPHLEAGTLLTIGGGIVVCLMVPVIIWNYPRYGLMLVFLCTTLLDMDPRAQNTQKLTSNIPVFLNFNNIGEIFHIGGLSAFKFSPAEIIIVLALLSWLVRSIAQRTLKIERGPFLGVLIFYAITTSIGYIHGYISGGDPTMALWEVRAQYYPLIMYFVVLNLVTERKHVEQLLWFAIVGLGLLSVVGLISYFQLGGVVGEQGILDHEDSLVLNVAFFLLMFLALNKGNRAMVRTCWVFLPTTIFTVLENQRRAGIAAFVIAFVASLPIMWTLFEARRKQIGIFIGAFAVLAAIYLPVAWNASGAWALPARAIRSNSSPDTRDQGSDNYREAENFDLKFTRDTSPWYGYGYGKPFIQVQVLPNVTTNFLQYFAHNSIMWIWMRTGHLGFFAFLLMIATVFIRGLQICKGVKDPVLLCAGLMGVIFLLMAYIYGKYDLQFTNYRTMMMMGIWLGLLGALPRLTKQEETPTAPKSEDGSWRDAAWMEEEADEDLSLSGAATKLAGGSRR